MRLRASRLGGVGTGEISAVMYDRSMSYRANSQDPFVLAGCFKHITVVLCRTHLWAAGKPTTGVTVFHTSTLALILSGPLWWAGKHRRHHRYSDVEGDPHSLLIAGMHASNDARMHLDSF